MKYLFLSDIHGSLTRLKEVLAFFDNHHYDMLCLLGDLLNYGPRNGLPEGLDAMGVAQTLNQYAHKIVAVRGNCDAEVDQMLLHFPMMQDQCLLVDDGLKIHLTHGHLPVYQGSGKIADIVISGHTHLWKLERDTEGMIVCNTGSPTFPKSGNEGTFATYEHKTFSVRNLKGEILASLETDNLEV